MKVCIAGKNNIAVDILIYALNYFPPDQICVTLNRGDSFKNTWQKSLGFFAKKYNISILSLEEVMQIPDIIFLSLEFDRIVDPEKFLTNKLFNIHFSYLPEYKGMYTSLFPILHGKEYSGVTLHRIDSGIDTGEIIDQVKFNIEGLTSFKLYQRYLNEGVKLVKNNFENILNDKCKSFKQSWNKSTYFSKSSFNFQNHEINLYQTGFQISNFVRALDFRPYQMPTFRGQKINDVEFVDYSNKCKVGTILEDNNSYYLVSTIDCILKLNKDHYENLINAIIENNTEKVRFYCPLLRDINEKDKNGWSPIIRACYVGNIEIVKILKNHGANLYDTNLNGTTTLMYATAAFERNGNDELISFLLREKVNPNSKDIHGKDVKSYINNNVLQKLFSKYD
ncbi:MAG: ankyrin repeat domain-containing protein [Ignavibacterium sp.]